MKNMKKFIKVIRVYRRSSNKIVLRKEVIINSDQIVLIEKENNLLTIHLTNNDKVEVEMTLDQLQEKLEI